MKASRLTRAVPPLMLVLMTAAFVFIILYLSLLSVLPSRGTHLETDEMQEYNNKAISYLKGPPFAPNTLEFLTPEEQAHMSDVKLLFDIAFILALVSGSFIIGMLIVFFTRMREHAEELIGRTLYYSGATILLICLLFGLAALLSFEKFWVLFHVFLFPQGNWMFPSGSLLIQLYPSTFFEAAVLQFFLQILAVGTVSFVVGLVIERMRHHTELFKGKF